MDFMSVGLENLEAAMNLGSAVAEQIDNIVQVAKQPENPPVTCDVCRCDW